MLHHRTPAALPDRGRLQPQRRAGRPHTCLQGQPSASSADVCGPGPRPGLGSKETGQM